MSLSFGPEYLGDVPTSVSQIKVLNWPSGTSAALSRPVTYDSRGYVSFTVKTAGRYTVVFTKDPMSVKRTVDLTDTPNYDLTDTKQYVDAMLIESATSTASGLDHTQAAPTAWSASNLVLTKEQMISGSGLTSIYWPWVIETTDVDGALGRFYLYWSTDHDSGAGGVAMAYADSPEGPWTVYGHVYNDAVEGQQTETPSVIVRGPNDLIMYYHNTFSGLGNQTTCYAKSSDGITWTRHGYAMNWPNTQLPGDGHTGYAKVYRHAPGYIAYTLFGGTDYSRQAIWYSLGGEKWTLDRRLFVNQVNYTGSNDYRLSMSLTPFQWKNDVWAFLTSKTPSSGSSVPVGATYYVAKMREDMRGFKSSFESVPFIPNCVIGYNGKLYGFNTGSTGVTYRSIEA